MQFPPLLLRVTDPLASSHLHILFRRVAGIIASKRCNNVKIYNNEVYNGGAQAVGIFLHRSTDSAEVYGKLVDVEKYN